MPADASNVSASASGHAASADLLVPFLFAAASSGCRNSVRRDDSKGLHPHSVCGFVALPVFEADRIVRRQFLRLLIVAFIAVCAALLRRRVPARRRTTISSNRGRSTTIRAGSNTCRRSGSGWSRTRRSRRRSFISPFSTSPTSTRLRCRTATSSSTAVCLRISKAKTRSRRWSATRSVTSSPTTPRKRGLMSGFGNVAGFIGSGPDRRGSGERRHEHGNGHRSCPATVATWNCRPTSSAANSSRRPGTTRLR